MHTETPNDRPNSRRNFLAGATAAGISAIAASSLAPQATAASSSDPVKLVCNIRRRPDLTPAAFYDYWLNSHGPFATQQIKTLRGYRYVQSHTTDSPLNPLIRTTRGTGEPFDGVTEVWWHSEADLLSALATPEGQLANQRLVDDEKKFIDLSRSSYFMTKEYPFLT